MLRSLKPVLIVLFCIALAGCQKYTSGLVQSAGRADEAVVLSNLRSIMLAENAYNLSNGSYGNFEQLTSGGFLDARFKGARPSLNQYSYTMTVTEKSADAATSSYSCNADPEPTGDRAGRHFYVDSTSNDMHVNATQSASATDEIIKP
jgi:Tfp pilus assembly protein PilE